MGTVSGLIIMDKTLWAGWLQISDTDVVRVHRLDTEEEFCHVVEHSPTEGVGVLTPSILQIIVSLIVEHLVAG